MDHRQQHYYVLHYECGFSFTLIEIVLLLLSLLLSVCMCVYISDVCWNIQSLKKGHSSLYFLLDPRHNH